MYVHIYLFFIDASVDINFLHSYRKQTIQIFINFQTLHRVKRKQWSMFQSLLYYLLRLRTARRFLPGVWHPFKSIAIGWWYIAKYTSNVNFPGVVSASKMASLQPELYPRDRSRDNFGKLLSLEFLDWRCLYINFR